jgi:hypothetical protein
MIKSPLIFFNEQPASIQRFVLDMVQAKPREPNQRETIKAKYPGRYTDEEVGLLIIGALIELR